MLLKLHERAPTLARMTAAPRTDRGETILFLDSDFGAYAVTLTLPTATVRGGQYWG